MSVFFDNRLTDILQEFCTPLIQFHHPVDLGITHFRRDGGLDSDSQFGGQSTNELEQFCALFSRICLYLECSQLSEFSSEVEARYVGARLEEEPVDISPRRWRATLGKTCVLGQPKEFDSCFRCFETEL